jgi:hypothetical protein
LDTPNRLRHTSPLVRVPDERQEQARTVREVQIQRLSRDARRARHVGQRDIRAAPLGDEPQCGWP